MIRETARDSAAGPRTPRAVEQFGLERNVLAVSGAVFLLGAGEKLKNLTVSGGGFDQATEILLDGASQKTQFKSPTRVVGKKAGLGIRAGDTVRVLTSDGSQSNDFAYYPFP
jgi:hypothetical protein